MKTPEYIRFEEMLTEARSTSDRSCALILAANLDNRLRELLGAFFIDVSSSYENQVFEGNGCLSTFSSRISLCYMLGLIADNEHHDLNLIKKIRNYFAHEEHGWGFNTQEIKDRCRAFRMIQEAKKLRPEIEIDLDNPRDVFQISAASLTMLLLHKTKKAKKEKRFTPNPGKIF